MGTLDKKKSCEIAENDTLCSIVHCVDNKHYSLVHVLELVGGVGTPAQFCLDLA